MLPMWELATEAAKVLNSNFPLISVKQWKVLPYGQITSSSGSRQGTLVNFQMSA